MKNKDQYPPNWEEIKLTIRERDNYTCQHCGCKHRELRTSQTGKTYTAYLAVAHLDHDKENWGVKLDRLLLLCQACHLKNDREHNLTKAKSTNAITKREAQSRLKAELRESNITIAKLKKNKYIPNQSVLVSIGDKEHDLVERLKRLGLSEREDILNSLMEVVKALEDNKK